MDSIESVYIPAKFVKSEEYIEYVVYSQLKHVNTKMNDIQTRISDHDGQRIRHEAVR